MGQSDIIEFLKKNPNKWFTCKQLQKELLANRCCIARALKQLRRYNLVEFELKGVFGVMYYMHYEPIFIKLEDKNENSI